MESGFSVMTLFNSVANFMVSGGIFMWVILLVWVIGLVIAFERLIRLGRYDLDGSSFMNEVQRYVLSNDIQGAIRVCSGSVGLLAKVLKSGLKRANQGVEQMQNAIDATALEVIPKIELRMSYIGLLANISTLFGLLGTVQGLIETFTSLTSVDPAQKSELLAKGISVAMNTTALGLLSAISLMIIHAVLTSKSEKIVNEIDEFSVKLLDLVGTKKEGQGNS